MRKFLVFLFLLNAVTGFSQDTITRVNPVRIDSSSGMKNAYDSTKSHWKDQEQKEWEEQNARNLNNLSQYLNERKAKEKRNALIRIGVGLLFLAVLMVGLRRRKKINFKK